jgi:hypothetical protein
MRKQIILAILCLFLSSTLWAADYYSQRHMTLEEKGPVELSRLNALVIGATVASAACSTPDNGDILDEGFLGAGYQVAGWTEVIGAGGSINEDTTLSGTPPTSSCTEGVRIVASGANTYVYWDNGSALDASVGDIDITFDVRVSSATTTGEFTDQRLFVPGTSTDPSATNNMFLRIFRFSSVLYLRADSTGNSTSVAITPDAWITVKIHLDASDVATSYLQVTGAGAPTTCDVAGECAFTSLNVDPRYFHFGGCDGIGAGEVVDVQIGYISINTP